MDVINLFKEFLNNFFELANAMSPYILIGLIVAGFLKAILPNNFISNHLGKRDFKSVIKATLVGIPMPVCSCSVIPLAKSLDKEGASRGAVQSFLISTPITGVDSILTTYSFFGWFFTIYRVITSIIIAITAGVLQNIFDKDKRAIEQKRVQPYQGFSLKPQPDSSLNSLIKKDKATFNQVKFSCNLESSRKESLKEKLSLRYILNYAFNVLFKDIAKSLLFGLVLGAVLATFLPKEIILNLSEYHLISYIIVILISMPLYVCATSSLPIGASLLMSGLNIGAVFVFLTAGPATNSVTMSIVKDIFGKRALFIYIITISLLSILFGVVLDNVFTINSIDINLDSSHSFNLINYITTAIMLLLIIYYWRKR